MKEFQTLNQEGQENLRIVEHLDMQKLPESLQQWLHDGLITKAEYGVYRKVG